MDGSTREHTRSTNGDRRGAPVCAEQGDTVHARIRYPSSTASAARDATPGDDRTEPAVIQNSGATAERTSNAASDASSHAGSPSGAASPDAATRDGPSPPFSDATSADLAVGGARDELCATTRARAVRCAP